MSAYQRVSFPETSGQYKPSRILCFSVKNFSCHFSFLLFVFFRAYSLSFQVKRASGKMGFSSPLSGDGISVCFLPTAFATQRPIFLRHYFPAFCKAETTTFLTSAGVASYTSIDSSVSYLIF